MGVEGDETTYRTKMTDISNSGWLVFGKAISSIFGVLFAPVGAIMLLYGGSFFYAFLSPRLLGLTFDPMAFVLFVGVGLFDAIAYYPYLVAPAVPLFFAAHILALRFLRGRQLAYWVAGAVIGGGVMFLTTSSGFSEWVVACKSVLTECQGDSPYSEFEVWKQFCRLQSQPCHVNGDPVMTPKRLWGGTLIGLICGAISGALFWLIRRPDRDVSEEDRAPPCAQGSGDYGG